VSYLRSLAINTLIQEAVDLFIRNEALILSGELENSLLDMSKYKAQIDTIINVSVEKYTRAGKL
jgi:dGTPase